MKITTERLKEIIKEELGQMRSPEYNGEASMMKSQLFKISNYARELHNMIGDDDNLPEWMQSKIAQIDQMIGSVKHALEYDQVSGDYQQNQVMKEYIDPDADHIVVKEDGSFYNVTLYQKDEEPSVRVVSPFEGETVDEVIDDMLREKGISRDQVKIEYNKE